MITDKDTIIIKHAEAYGFITVRQMVTLNYKHLAFGYDYARRRANKLVANGYLFKQKNYSTNETIYTIENKSTKISLHRRLIYDFYTEVCSMGANIEIFQVEPIWRDDVNKKMSSDAFIVFTVDNTRYYMCLEVNTSNNNVNNTINKYEKFINEGVIQPHCNGFEPIIVLINKFNSKLDYDENALNVKQISIDLTDINKVFI